MLRILQVKLIRPIVSLLVILLAVNGFGAYLGCVQETIVHKGDLVLIQTTDNAKTTYAESPESLRSVPSPQVTIQEKLWAHYTKTRTQLITQANMLRSSVRVFAFYKKNRKVTATTLPVLILRI